MYYDIHTHKIPGGNGDIFAVMNIYVADAGDNHYLLNADIPCSIGIHPWYIKKENIRKELDLIEKYITFPNIKMLGECGLDKLCQTDFELQKETFSSQILISEKYSKPMLIHCVKSFDEIIACRKKHAPKQFWIIHGFRGNPQQAKQLTDNGFFLSFGFNYNEKSIKNIPMERVFFETDDSGRDIRDIYKKAAGTLGISIDNLIREVETNIRKKT